MIKQLLLQNLILVESATISFEKGLNIISGETGAGKTALIEAIRMIRGERFDHSKIRKGAEKAQVTALFEVNANSTICRILSESGIEFDQEQELIIQREVHINGKSRAFVNSQNASLSLLQKLGHYLIDLIDQHSYQLLRASDNQREFLDLFAETQTDLEEFQTSWSEEKETKATLDAFMQQSESRGQRLQFLQFQIEEIERLQLKQGEEEQLFEEYERQNHAQEITEKLNLATQGIDDHLIPHLKRNHKILADMARRDSSLETPTQLIEEALVQLEEASHLLTRYLSDFEWDAQRISYLEERLKHIEQLKKKHAKTFEELLNFQDQLKQDLIQLENWNETLEEKKSQHLQIQNKTNIRANILHQKRIFSAQQLEQTLSHALQELNISKAEIKIDITLKQRTNTGDDLVNFLLKANVGESYVPVKDSSSGGELSRLLFAIKTTLAEKNQPFTMVFDEIDANVGGETAAIIGEKLKSLGLHRQVICITHFPQVALKADHHLRVYKTENNGRTHSMIEQLSPVERKKELIRMLGGKEESKTLKLQE